MAFTTAGHDVSTIHLQQLNGAPDDKVLVVCREESRVLVTLDLDFANPLVNDPRTTAGVAVLRLPSTPGPSDVQAAIVALLRALDQHAIAGALWGLSAQIACGCGIHLRKRRYRALDPADNAGFPEHDIPIPWWDGRSLRFGF